MVIIVINNLISLGITLAITVVAPLVIGYAGFLMVIQPTGMGDLSKARGMLLNLVIGIVIALSAWLIVDAIMAVLYNPTNALKTWSSLITSGGIDPCLKQAGSLDTLNQVQGSGVNLQVQGVNADGSVTVTTGSYSATYDPGIEKQLPTASPALASLIGCIKSRVPSSVGRISSISDNVIMSGKADFKQCAEQGHALCSHTVNSCHYGGTGKCNGKSYAVDFGDEQNAGLLIDAARACGATALNEGDHVHVSVGAKNGCACDTKL